MRAKVMRLCMFALSACLCLSSIAWAAEETSVTFWHYGGQKDLDVMAQVVNDFEAESGINVELQIVPPPGPKDKWIVAVAGGVPPDLTLANLGFFAEFAAAIQPLDNMVARSRLVKANRFWPAHWDAQVFGGQMLGLPFRANSQVVLYNKDLFELAGIGTLPETWDEFAALTKKLTLTDGNDIKCWGYSFRGAQLNRTVWQWTERNAWHNFDEDYTTAFYQDRKLMVALDFLTELVFDLGTTALSQAPLSGTGGIARGTTAMLTDGPWGLSNIYNANPAAKVGAFLPPKGPSGEQPYANYGGENLIMFRDAKQKDAAFALMEYLCVTRNAEYNKMIGAFFPVVRDVARDREWFQSEIWGAVLQNYDEGRLKPNVAGTPGGVKLVTDTAFDEALENIFRKHMPPETALASVQEKAHLDINNPDLRAAVAARR